MKSFLMLDYDGTLTPIVKQPNLALLSPKRKKILASLARNPKIKMAIISGRKLSDIKKLVGIPNIIYVGNHGFEIEINGERIIHLSAKRFIPMLKKIKMDLLTVRRIKGVLIEDKKYTLSVHFRLIPANHLKSFYKLFYRTIRPWRKKVKITSGKKIFEIRPPVDWDKGKAVKWLISKLNLKGYLPIYIGDDKTDADAFRLLKRKGVTIHVGGGKTAAKMRIKDIDGVYHYLRGLIRNES